ncbi:uncharacterized protein DEA37_0000543, partial [Paragonimus westermani]
MTKDYELCCSISWISPGYSFNFQLGSAYSILPSAVLLFAPLDHIFENATAAVKSQYMSTVVNLADKEAATAYYKLIRPMVYVFFIHQSVILTNIFLVMLGTCCRSVFLTHLSMGFMVLITITEAIGYGIYYTNIRKW